MNLCNIYIRKINLPAIMYNDIFPQVRVHSWTLEVNMALINITTSTAGPQICIVVLKL